MQPQLRWQLRFKNFSSALTELKLAVEKDEYTVLERSGLIQLFEISFELAWKTMKDLLEYEGYDVKSPRGTIKQAFQNEIISDGELWLKLLDGRNMYAHIYSQGMAKSVVHDIKIVFMPLLLELETTLGGYL